MNFTLHFQRNCLPGAGQIDYPNQSTLGVLITLSLRPPHCGGVWFLQITLPSVQVDDSLTFFHIRLRGPRFVAPSVPSSSFLQLLLTETTDSREPVLDWLKCWLIAQDEGESWGVEWFPRRMMDGRALELDARFEIACVRGSTNTRAVSTSGSL